MQTPTPQRADPVRVGEDQHYGFASTRTGYATLGACAGAFLGMMALPDIARDERGPMVFAFWGGVVVAGALVGAELHRTRSWQRFGAKGTMARWTYACTSAAATIASPFLFLGKMSGWEYLGAMGFGALMGAGYGFEALREEWRSRASKADLAKEYRRGFVLAAIGLLVILAVWLIL